MKDILPELNNKDYIMKLDEQYDFHFCRKDEVEELVEFIDEYWRKNHIFVISRELLDWQHFDKVNDRYNFVIAKHKESGKIHSILGFVPTYQFDEKIEAIEIWPCIWKSRKDIHVKGLGVSLYYYLKSNIPVETFSILGISEIALSIYKHWNFTTGKIDQYYYPNKNASEVISSDRVCNSDECTHVEGWCLKEIGMDEYVNIDINSELFNSLNKYKSKNYYINRFFTHPIYKYKFFALIFDGCYKTIFISRECEADNIKCLRIVDCIGDITNIGNVRYELEALMQNNNYEYIDLISAGISNSVMQKTGFINRKNNPDTIIPNYFEPFLKKNIDLDFAFKTIDNEISPIFFKADADQDRPNVL